MSYAENTTVSPENSRAEIEKTLRRYGADQVVSGWDGNRSMIAFRANGKSIRFILMLPAREEFSRCRKGRGWTQRSESGTIRAWEQAIRQRFRALGLCIKAKLESVQAQIETFEEAFMPHIILPDGTTMAETLLPQMEEIVKNGKMPSLLPQLPAPGQRKVTG